ncbi:MAG: rhodanese-like domain-containing protein [Nitrospira sp. SB0672_bin_25]|nr:rhodanese-like domain-containing protein [Nitrospira sp. SB0666_bin_27]MYJ54018.1 rhodanese-like domain-containing protein [Nitrospira sp. SB0672_bin_25]
MTVLMVIGLGILIGGIVLMWWRLGFLSQTVKDLTRQQYDGQNESRETARQQSEALAILRLQLAHLASGKELDGTLVRTGTLYRQADADEARQLVEQYDAGTISDLTVVDVRSEKEFLQGHVPGAKHIPFEYLEARFRAEVPKETKHILVYCSQGERSRLACDFLSRDGYTTLVNLRDGFQKWTGPVLGTGSLDLVQIQPKASDSHVVRERAQL